MEIPAAEKTAESDSIRVTRRLAATPERVFEAWTNPVLLRRWLAPIADSDARAGGRYRLEVSKPEGSHVVTGVYREFAPAERLVMTWIYEGPMAPEGKMDALLTVEFRKDGAGAEIGLHHKHLTAPRYYETIRQGAWTKALDSLEALLAHPSP